MRPLCCGRNRAFVGEILEIGTRFGTEGSVVRIHSPRPIPKKSSEIRRVQSGSSLGFECANRVARTECSVLQTLAFREIVRHPVVIGGFRAQTLMLTLC
jgi:hypothetical protein